MRETEVSHSSDCYLLAYATVQPGRTCRRNTRRLLNLQSRKKSPATRRITLLVICFHSELLDPEDGGNVPPNLYEVLAD